PCAASLWSAATALLETWPRLADRLYYEGGSFGGGMGALMLPWDARYRRAVLVVPTFGNHPVRLECPCVGSGESVRRWHRGHPEVTEVLPYYDAATAAKRIRIPVLCAPALFDPAVPPPGQFSVANALAGPKRLFVFSAGHHDHPSLLPEQAAFARMTREWLDPEREPWTEPPGPHAIILGRADGATESR
ncbi:MAG: acetylxylan esterase, partial [Spirochaetes bacterium]|nr:acetylxylan esterase [Spirochaetota bacterium]